MILWYFLAYFVVTLIGVLHTIFNVVVLHMKSMKESDGMGDAYNNTKPWHVVYNIIIFPIFTLMYFKGVNNLTLSLVIMTSLTWGIITIILDLVGWVLIKHPWSLSFKEFYIDYQPWITLIYVTIFLSPFLSFLLLK